MVKCRKNEENGDCSDENCRRYQARIITEKQLAPHLDEGWSLVKELRSGKIVVKRLLHASKQTPKRNPITA
jgi:hypothetical protein